MWTGLRHTHTHTHLQDNLQMMAISPHTCDGCVDPPSITHRTSRQSLAGFASTKRPIVTLYRSVHMVPAHDSQKHKLNVAYQHEQTRLYVYLAVHTISSTARGHEVQLCYEMAAQVWLCELEWLPFIFHLAFATEPTADQLPGWWCEFTVRATGRFVHTLTDQTPNTNTYDPRVFITES